MANATLRKLVVEYGGEGLVDIMSHLQKKSGFLQTALAIPANGSWYHKYKRVNALPSWSFNEVNGGVTDQTVNSDLLQLDVKTLKAIMSEDDIICKNWPTGVRGYFEDNYPKFAEALGQKISASVFYGTNSTFGDVSGFLGIHELAKSRSKVVYQASGATGYRTSIIAVKFDPTACGLVFNPKVVADTQSFMSVDVLNNGNVVAEVTNTTTGAKKAVYQCLYEAAVAFLSATSYDVATITQLDSSHLPTAPYMDLLLDTVKANVDDTIIYTSRAGRRWIRTLKTTALQMGVMDKDYNIQVDFWNGVPIVLDENISEVETTAID